MSIDAVVTQTSDGTNPVVVGLGLVVHILQHVFLHLVQFLQIYVLSHVDDLVEHNLRSHIALLRLHGAVNEYRTDGAIVIAAQSGLCHDAIGSACLLTYLLNIDHRQNLSYHVGTNDIVECVVHIGVGPNHDGECLWRFHLTLEVVDDLTLEHLVNILTLHYFVGVAGECSQILLNERTDGSLVVVTDDGEGEGSSVAGLLLGHLQDAVVAHLLQVVHQQWSEALAVVLDGECERVAEHSLGLQQFVLQHQLGGLHHVVVRLLVLVDVGEVEVNQLEHGLYIVGS